MLQESTRGSEGVSRRNFIAGAGASAAGAVALAGCTEGGGNTGGTNENGDSTDSGGDGNDETELSGEVSITGSSTVGPLATAVAERFEEEYPQVSTNIQVTGSGGGFENFFCPGDSDINNASRPIKDSELEACQSNGVEPHEIKVATDALTVVINNDNDWATEMTFDQVAQIYGPDAPEGQTWADIDSDWPDQEIVKFGAATTSGTFDYFTETVMGEEGAHTQNYQPTENDRSIVQGVQGNVNGIGYFGFSFFFNNPDAVTAVSLAQESGDEFVAPSLETALDGSYPLSRPLFTYPNKKRLDEPQIAEFCRFFIEQSTNEELVANTVGYVPNRQERADKELEELNAAIEEANA